MTHHCPGPSPVVLFIQWLTTVRHQVLLSCLFNDSPLSGTQSCCPVHSVTHPCRAPSPVVRLIQWRTTVRFSKRHTTARHPVLLSGSINDTLLSGTQSCCPVHQWQHCPAPSPVVRFIQWHHCLAPSPVVRLIKWHTTVRHPVLLSGSFSDTPLSGTQSCCPVHSMTHHCPAPSPVVRFIHDTPLSGTQSCCPVHSVTHHCPAPSPVVRFIKWHTIVLHPVLLSGSFIDTPLSCN